MPRTSTRHLRRPLLTRNAPVPWHETLFHPDKPMERRLFCLDAYRANSKIIITCPGHKNTDVFLQEAQVKLDGVVQKVIAVNAPGGYRIEMSDQPGGILSLHWLGEEVTLPLPEDETHLMADLNVMTALIEAPDPRIIADWARFHVNTHKANAFCLLRRVPPDCDPAHLDQEVFDALTPIRGMKQLVILNADHPLGEPGKPAQSSHYFAPDAPGKKPRTYNEDIWRAPLQEVGIWDILHRRFFAQARAVLRCDISDLLVPPAKGEQTVFDAAAASQTYLKFSGVNVFPWQLQEPDTPTHGDHACIIHGGSRSGTLWCVSPMGPLNGASWRPFRVSTSTPDPVSQTFSYYRCVAVRHPGETAGALAPKSVLTDEPRLRDVLRTHFNADPRTAPEPLAAPHPRTLKNEMMTAVVTMKNEGPFILEWLAYHRAVGFTNFLVYTNDCTDGTDAFFDLLQSHGIVTHLDNPFRKMDLKPQHGAYFDAQEHPMVQQSDWVIPMDADEFVNIHAGDGTLHDLFAARPEANMFSFTWRLFGNADIGPYEDDYTIRQFNQCAPELIRKPHQAWGFKTLFRPLGYFKKFGVHRPKGLRPEAMHLVNWVNGSGNQMPDQMLRTGWRSSMGNWGYDLVTLNHYACRSAESYLVKRDRGRVNHVNRDQGLNYWFRMNHNAQQDTRIHRMIPAMEVERAKLLSLPGVKDMHESCVANHRRRIDELMEAPEYRALYDEITEDRLRALSRMLNQFGMQTFMDGPDSIPQDFHLTAELPKADP